MLVSTELTQALFKKPSAHAPPHIHKRKNHCLQRAYITVPPLMNRSRGQLLILKCVLMRFGEKERVCACV